ncbi:MAG: 4-hydroxy-tetrahydrodipicolinate reductase [Clostridiales Family XIII bacterium]|jgi:4-hydroxy-tetrahydrodipicolinate reductase|nr:4-hydroxy-tetrahydrodipicolinate reductase [Clostridiales Family XIII bacterium]
MNYILNGINGRMGQVLIEIIKEEGGNVIAGIDRNSEATANDAGIPIYENPAELLKENSGKIADAIIDFSNFTAVPALLEYAKKTGTPVVVCTTALGDTEKALMREASKVIPVFNSSNMSIGINLIAKMGQLAMPVLEDNFNVEIIEMHHDKKVDSPSGTAILLADAINESCKIKKDYIYGRHSKSDAVKKSDLGIHAVRGGTVPGIHTVIWAGPDELIEIKHTVYSRSVFAQGAVKAASWIADKDAGMYSMNDLI